MDVRKRNFRVFSLFGIFKSIWHIVKKSRSKVKKSFQGSGSSELYKIVDRFKLWTPNGHLLDSVRDGS